jgi:hypothetical protein
MVGAGKQAITNGISLSLEAAKSPSNSVYIDNLVLSILYQLNSDESKLNLYFLNDDDEITYLDFYEYFTAAFDQKVAIQENTPAQKNSVSNGKLSELAKEIKLLARSKELRKFLLKVFNSKKIGFPARWTVARFAFLESKLRNTDGPIYRSEKDKSSIDVIEASTPARVEMTCFKKNFPNFEPIERRVALELTKKWLQFSKL